jgi:hypothetical protein
MFYQLLMNKYLFAAPLPQRRANSWQATAGALLGELLRTTQTKQRASTEKIATFALQK